jgi:hypothetical protein
MKEGVNRHLVGMDEMEKMLKKLTGKSEARHYWQY